MRKGFTLIELLAVIVILAIILVIAVPQILKVIESSKRETFSSSAMLVAKNVLQTIALGDSKPNTIDCLSSEYGVNTTDYELCTAYIKYGDTTTVEVSLIGKGKFDNLVVTSTDVKAKTSTLGSNLILLKDRLLETVGTKEVVIGIPGTENGLYKWGDKYIYRGGITRTNTGGYTDSNYDSDEISGNEVSNYIKVPWESYGVGENCDTTTNKCYRIMNINTDGSITIVRDRILGDQRFDNTINTAARVANSNYTITYGYNDLLANTPTTGHPEEYRLYSAMYTYLYGTSGYENTTIKPYASILQPIDVCLNKINDYAGINHTSYTSTTRVTDTCNVSGKSNTTVVNPLRNKYVRMPYLEEYLNASTESTCIQDNRYQCRNQNYLYQKQTYWTNNGHSWNSWYLQIVAASGNSGISSAYNSYGVRPVITLKSNVLITGGLGTQTDPYVIKW